MQFDILYRPAHCLAQVWLAARTNRSSPSSGAMVGMSHQRADADAVAAA